MLSQRILEGQAVQIGTLADPSSVVSNLSPFDEERAHKSMFISISDEEAKVIEAYDEANPEFAPLLRQSRLEEKHIKIKVNPARTALVDTDGDQISVEELIREGNRITAIVVPVRYSFEGKHGISLQAKAVCLVSTSQQVRYEFR